MSSVICFASKCKWNDSERDECTKPTIRIKPSIDDADPAFCDDYSDPWYEEGADDDSKRD